MILNKKKPFGEVCGGDIPYKYTQAGKFFNSEGVEVKEDGSEIKAQPVKTTK